MNADERQMLADLFERVRSAGAQARDPQAESFINDAVRALPFAPYVLAQTVLIQQQALEAASRRLQELQAQAAPQGETSFLGGLGKALFGGPSAPASAPPQNYRPAPAQPYPPQQGYPQQPGYAPIRDTRPTQGTPRLRPVLGARRRRLQAAASCRAPCARLPASPAA